MHGFICQLTSQTCHQLGITKASFSCLLLSGCFSTLLPTGRGLLNPSRRLSGSHLPNLTLAMSTAEQKTCSHSLSPTCLLPPTVAIQISQISGWILAVLLLDRGAKYLYPTRRRVVLSISVCGRHEYALVWRRPGTTLSWSAPPLPSVALKTGSSTPSCTEHWDSPWSLLRFMQADPCTLCTWYTCQIAFLCLDRRNKKHQSKNGDHVVSLCTSRPWTPGSKSWRALPVILWYIDSATQERQENKHVLGPGYAP